jgi:hypothetical protein
MRSQFKEVTPIFFFIGSGLLLAGVYYYIGRTVYDPLALSIILIMLGFAVHKDSKTLYVLSLLYMGGYFCGGPGGGWIGIGWSTYNEITAMVTGVSLVLTGHWLRHSNYISMFPLWMFAGTGFALAGFYALMPAPFEPVAIGVAALAIYGALLLQSRAVLAAAVLSVIGFIVEYSAKYFADTIGWPILLILLGIMTLSAGFMFARLSGRIKAAAA